MTVAPTAQAVSITDFEASAMRKFRWRMIPLLAICYFIYRLDLLNVGFAGLTMNKELGLSATAFGFGVGVFYWGFFLCQIPSNLALERWGARFWLPIIMLLWSVLPAAWRWFPASAVSTSCASFLARLTPAFFPA